MSGEHTHSHDSKGQALDSQAVVPLKRNRSSEQEESDKRHQQDPKRSAESRFKVAREMFRQAGEQQLHITLDDLIEANASSQALEAAYSPFFKGLARAIVDRDDIPVPPGKLYAEYFLAGDPNLRARKAERAINNIIDY
ncbi:hypothetical protein C0992_005323, partial [Termitomyces sp. T32_za158]